MHNFKWMKIVKGEMHKHLKDIPILGRVNYDKDFTVYGCHEDDEALFYKALLDYDIQNNIHGFENESDVEKYWTTESDMFLVIANGEYEIIEYKSPENI